jgi:hypothetical protein
MKLIQRVALRATHEAHLDLLHSPIGNRAPLCFGKSARMLFVGLFHFTEKQVVGFAAPAFAFAAHTAACPNVDYGPSDLVVQATFGSDIAFMAPAVHAVIAFVAVYRHALVFGFAPAFFLEGAIAFVDTHHMRSFHRRQPGWSS